MTGSIPAVLATAALFLLILPGVGAFGVRRRWRKFRKQVLLASLSPPLTYATLHSPSAAPGRSTVRLIGSLESIQGEQTLWIRGTDISVAADMSRSDVYVVSTQGPREEDTVPMRTSWNRLGSLPEGARVLVCGTLDTDGKHPFLRAPRGGSLAAVFFDGPAETLVRRSIWSGRQANEYWNSFTPSSLAGATLSLLLWAYILVQQGSARVAVQVAVALASVPLLPLLPPAVAFFYLYRVLWRRGRRYRALRDVVSLAERFPGDTGECGELPGGGRYCRWRISEREARALEDAGIYRVPLPPHLRSDAVYLYGNPDIRSSGEVSDSSAGSRDALAEPIILDGECLPVVSACQRRAKLLEFASTLIFLTGLAVNFLIVLFLLGLVL